MVIGIPKEIKNNESRVAVTPAGVHQLIASGHQVLIEQNAGLGSGFTNEAYAEAGATIVSTAKDAWLAEMVLKVKEPQPQEFGFFRSDLLLFTYLHLAAEKELTDALIESGITAVAYETVQHANGVLPLLTPMSEVAGRMATQIGAGFLEKPHGGKGILLGGVPGVKRAKVTIIGGGVAGTNAAKMAVGMGAEVTIIDVSAERLAHLQDIFGFSVTTLMSNSYNIAQAVAHSDLVIGAVLIPGAKAPKLVTDAMVANMEAGSVLVDIAIDQGGIFETTDRITTHDNPIYYKHGVVHYAVANMPGAVPRTSTFALTNVTLPYALSIANKGLQAACSNNISLKKGINVINGKVTVQGVADAFGYSCCDAADYL